MCRTHPAALAGLLLLYWAVSLGNLTVVPPVHEDEPWQASTGWKLATQGVFGSDVFAGFYGMEHHYYGFMPLHPMLLAVTFRIAGLGLFQDRFEPVAMGLLTLALTYALGRRLFGPGVGLLAVALLLFVRFTAVTRSQVSGILLLDTARIARYDMVVPVFGLASLHVYWSAARRPATARFLLAGFLAGLSGLSHVYGVFWIIVLGALRVGVWNSAGRRQLAAMAAGFAVPWLAYAMYVLRDVPDWIGQTRDYAPRFDLLNPLWYVSNLLREPRRYSPGLGPVGWHYLLRPGLWATLIALPASVLALARRGLRLGDSAARAIATPALVFPILFALLISLKLVSYAVTIAPLGALAMAWGGMSLWKRVAPSQGERRGEGAPSARQRTVTVGVRAALLAVLLAVAIEGATRMAAIGSAAAATTPYASFIARLRAYIPTGSRALGLHLYWLGLADLDYTSWFVPLLQANPRYWFPPLSIDEALDNIAPDVVLIDSRLGAGPGGSPASDPKLHPIYDWIVRRGYAQAAVIADPTYGIMEIYTPLCGDRTDGQS